MQQYKLITKIRIASTVLIFTGITTFAQENSIKKLIDSKDFVFVAQQVSPLRGPTRHLTSYYDLRVSGDTLQADLPYFGRAFSAPIHPDDAGIRFTSTSFEINIKDRGKNRWMISIDPDDAKDVSKVLLTVFENGNATLRVSSNNRQAISYQGFIKRR